jgi:hypothetical protein
MPRGCISCGGRVSATKTKTPTVVARNRRTWTVRNADGTEETFDVKQEAFRYAQRHGLPTPILHVGR